jgi:uncharacterized protein
MRFEWDDRKARANPAKHGVSFELAERVFADPLHLSRQDRRVDGEERWQTLGMVSTDLLLLVAHTYEEHEGDEVVRVISARRATAQERRRYEEEG